MILDKSDVIKSVLKSKMPNFDESALIAALRYLYLTCASLQSSDSLVL